MTVYDPQDPRYGSTPARELPSRAYAPVTSLFGSNQTALQRVSGLIDLGTLTVNGVIALRFLLKLMAANPANPFAALVYFLSRPFVAIFVSLTPTPSFAGIQIEFFDLVAILVYFLLSLAVVRLLWILFARLRPS